MKLNTSTTTQSNIVEDGSYTIANTEKMFRILSSQLYTNPIRAIVREICTNAHDAHILAGTPTRQFSVELPSHFSSVFRVRDYGPGLTHDQVRNIFTTYGVSTKDMSNEFNGALGLGSKSPFGYTNTFTVTSYFNGMATTYTMYMIAGLPKFTQGETFKPEQEEENGLAISVPVKSGDESRFVTEVAYILPMLEVVPTVNGRSIEKWTHFTQQKKSATKINADITITVIADQNKYPLLAIRMAGVLYPINIKLLEQSLQEDRRYGQEEAKIVINKINQLLIPTLLNKRNGSIVVEVPTGYVQFTPNREELSYDRDTIANITTLMHTSLEALLKTVDELMANVASKSAIEQIDAITLHPLVSPWDRTVGQTFLQAGIDQRVTDSYQQTSIPVLKRTQSLLLGEDRTKAISALAERARLDLMAKYGFTSPIMKKFTSPYEVDLQVYEYFNLDAATEIYVYTNQHSRRNSLPTFTKLIDINPIPVVLAEIDQLENTIYISGKLVGGIRQTCDRIAQSLGYWNTYFVSGNISDRVYHVFTTAEATMIKAHRDAMVGATSPSAPDILQVDSKTATQVKVTAVKQLRQILTDATNVLVSNTNYIVAPKSFNDGRQYRPHRSRWAILTTDGTKKYSESKYLRIVRELLPAFSNTYAIKIVGSPDAARDTLISSGILEDSIHIYDVDAGAALLKPMHTAGPRALLSLNKCQVRLADLVSASHVVTSKRVSFGDLVDRDPGYYTPEFIMLADDTKNAHRGTIYESQAKIGNRSVKINAKNVHDLALLMKRLGIYNPKSSLKASTAARIPVIIVRMDEYEYLKRRDLYFLHLTNGGNNK